MGEFQRHHLRHKQKNSKYQQMGMAMSHRGASAHQTRKCKKPLIL
jgi:hypothetical protein